MNLTKTKTLYNVKLVDGKLLFDTDFFCVGRELVTTLFTNAQSEPRMCKVASCTDTLLTIELADDSEQVKITIDKYIKDTVFWTMHNSNVTKEDILKKLERNNRSARRMLDSEPRLKFTALGERYDIKSSNMVKFTSYITEKPFIFIDNNDKAYTLSSATGDTHLGIGVIAMDYSESPDDYEEVGDFDSIIIFDRTRPVAANEFMSKFKKLVMFDAKTMTVEEDDLSKCVMPCEGYDHELVKKIPTKTVIACNCDSSVHAVLDISSLLWLCPDKTLISKIDHVHAAEYTSVSVTYDDIFNSIN